MNSFPWVLEPAVMSGFVIRATVVLATGLALAWLIRRKSAQIRHRLWTVTFFVLLLLPPLTLWAPQWQVPLLPAAAEADAETDAIRSPATPRGGSPAASAFAASAAGVRPTQVPVLTSGSPDAEAQAATEPQPQGVPIPTSGSPNPEPQAATESASGYRGESPGRRGGDSGSNSGSLPHPMLLWAIGCMAGLVSLAAGHLRFRGLVRRAHPLRDPLWQRELEAAAHRLGLRRDVRLLIGEAAGTPMTGGFWKPVILVPASAATWDSPRLKVVLMHELVHVRRRDALRQLMGGVVLALYWFHPLSWVASRLASISREEACDERVLELGSRPSEYARQLMSLAVGTNARRFPVAALSMARLSPSRLEKRIMAILRPRRPRPSALATAALVMAIGGLGVSVAVTHPVHREKADALVVLSDPSLVLPNPPAVLPNPPAVSAVDDDEARGAAILPPASTAEAPGSGSPMSDPGDPIGNTGEESVEAGAAGPVEDPAVEGRTPVVTEPDVVPEPFARALTTISRNAPPRSGLPGVDCESLPGGAGNVLAGGTTASGPERSGHDVVTVVVETVDGVRLCMRIRTDAVLEGGEVRSLAPDDWILLESEGDKVHRLIVRTGSGGFEYQWSVGGENRPFDEQAKEWRDGMLAVLGGHLEIGRIRREVSDLQDQISHHRNVVSGLQGQVSHDRGVVASLQGQVAYYQGVVAGLLEQISYHQSVVAGMWDDISYHRGVVSGLRDEISMHRARVAAFQEVKSTYEAQITAIIPRLKTADSSTRQSIERSISDWEGRIQGIEEQIASYGLVGKVSKIEERIRNYSLDVRVRNLEQRIQAYELQAGLHKIQAEIDEQSKLLNDATRRTEEAIRVREARIGEVEREVAAYYLDDKVARLEQQIRDLGADEAVARIEQSIEEERRKLLELIRRL